MGAEGGLSSGGCAGYNARLKSDLALFIQLQFHERIAHKLIYKTHESCYIYVFIIGANMRFDRTKSAMHSPGHSHSLFTSALDYQHVRAWQGAIEP